MDYVECVNLSMQTGVFFLLQCFWNYLSNAVAKKTFMSSWEFKFYIFWALGSVAIFPILQWYFRKDINMRETAPQLAYSIEVLITSALGIRSHRRFKRILNISSNLKHGAAQIVEKLAYFKDMNIYMTIVLFFYGSGLLIICVDGLTDAKLINSNKFAADLLIANCNIASVLMWIVGISIFHPRRSNSELESTIDSRSMTTTTAQNHRYNQGGDIEISNNKANHQGSSTFSDGGMKFNNNNRLSQRITNFIESKNGTLRSQGHFLRPMSPVEVDYPSVVDNERSFTPTSHQYRSSPSSPVESKTTMFSNQQHYPLQTMSGAISTRHDDFKFDPSVTGDNTFDYLQSPTKVKTNNNSYF
ncbi:MAG: hypothetical protein EXX96DRAFT_495323 [Benjaminiella poitrasii]|nr:MAG: hypothetical protein EXX96DRAFT_495323 [Benjaminiella poitrasii]